MKQSRRAFIRNLGSTGVLVLASPVAFAGSQKSVKVTILHTNDLHSQIDAYDADHPKYPGMGGFARRAALVDQIRQQEEHVLLLDAGDLFQGSPYYNFFKGALEISLMNKMGYDAMTLGNHEFDNGEDQLYEQLKKASYPIVCANYSFSKQHWRELVKPYIIKKAGGISIGILGISISPEGLIAKDNFEGITYEDAIESANATALHLKKVEMCDYVVALTHLGINTDKQMASESENIDMILGGHSHTFLEEPMVLKNKLNNDVIVNQMGWAGIYLGRIDLYFTNAEPEIYAARL